MLNTEGCMIKTLNPKHSCGTNLNHNFATARYLTGRYVDDFKFVTGVDVQEFKSKIQP